MLEQAQRPDQYVRTNQKTPQAPNVPLRRLRSAMLARRLLQAALHVIGQQNLPWSSAFLALGLTRREWPSQFKKATVDCLCGMAKCRPLK